MLVNSLELGTPEIRLDSRQSRQAPSIPHLLEDILSHGTVRGFAPKEHIFTEGDPKTSVYQILTGAVCLYKILHDGRRQVIGFAYSGDLIGLESGAVACCNAQATVATRIRMVPAAIVERIASQDPHVAMQLFQALARDMAAMREHLVCVGQRSASERLITFLLALARRRHHEFHDDDSIELPMTRADIADFLGLTIETVSRSFSKLKSQGLIEIDQGTTIHLKDVAALEALANGENSD